VKTIREAVSSVPRGPHSPQSGAPGEPKIVFYDGPRPNGNLPRGGQVQFYELDLVLPDLAQEVLKHLDRELFSRAPSIAEAERGVPGIIGDRQGLAVDLSEDGAEPAIGDARLPAVGDVEFRDVERTLGKADLFALGFVDLVARRDGLVAVRIELLRVGPVNGVAVAPFERIVQ
jgi:hypothetical protein